MTTSACTRATKARPEIGFDRFIKLAWADRALALLAAGSPPDEVRKALKRQLSRDIAGREALNKTLVVLSRMWLSPPAGVLSLRDEAVTHFNASEDHDHLLWHWGMALTGATLFYRVAETTGRLLRLQGTCSAGQVRRRMREQLGDRQVVLRATRRVLRTLVEWGVLCDTETPGLYAPGPVASICDAYAASWLVEARLRATNDCRGPVHGLVHSPALFPFDLSSVDARGLATAGNLELTTEALTEQVLILRGNGQ